MTKETGQQTEEQERWPVGRAILNRLRRTVNDPIGPYGPEEGADVFTRLYLTERDSCVPDELAGEELLLSIRSAYYWPLDALCSELKERLDTEEPLLIVVDPAYDDTTYYVVHTFERVVLSGGDKPWHFYWNSEDEMAAQLEDWYRTAAERLKPASPPTERLSEDGRYVVTLQLERRIRVQADMPSEARERAERWRDNEDDPDVQVVYEEIVGSRVEPAADDEGD